jgi:hypothetical protein
MSESYKYIGDKSPKKIEFCFTLGFLQLGACKQLGKRAKVVVQRRFRVLLGCFWCLFADYACLCDAKYCRMVKFAI